jgi:hypothetical protein
MCGVKKRVKSRCIDRIEWSYLPEGYCSDIDAEFVVLFGKMTEASMTVPRIQNVAK